MKIERKVGIGHALEMDSGFNTFLWENKWDVIDALREFEVRMKMKIEFYSEFLILCSIVISSEKCCFHC